MYLLLDVLLISYRVRGFLLYTTGKMATHIIHFTQEQARQLTGVTPGDLRHWKTCVPYLAEKSGKAARFSFADLVGLAVVSDLVGTYGLRVTSVSGAVQALFQALDASRPALLDQSVAILTPSTAVLVRREDVSEHLFAAASLVLPCAPLVSKLQTGLVPRVQPEQTALPFPPMILRSAP